MLRHARILFTALTLALTSSSLALAQEKKDRATKDDYSIDVSGSSSELPVGQSGVIKIVITPKNDMKIHPQAPLEVKLSEPEGVKVGKRKLARADITDKEAKSPALSTDVSGQKAGSYSVDADVSFFLCTDEFCQRMTDRVSIPLQVRDKQ